MKITKDDVKFWAIIAVIVTHEWIVDFIIGAVS